MTEAVNWSYTTVNAFRQCNRRFYFSTILATHGRKDQLRRKAYELKTMQTLKMWAGSVVDKIMEKVIVPAIMNKTELHFQEIADRAVKLAEAQFRFSKNGLYKDTAQKKGETDSYCILDIHEIKSPFTEAKLKESYDNIRNAVLNIPNIKMPDGKPLLQFLKEADALTPNVNTWHVDIGKAKVKPQIDLLAYTKWKPVVMDWKLSSSYTSDYARQLVICGIVVYLKRLENTDKKPYTYEDIKLFEVNLLKGLVKEHDFNEETVNELINYINLTGSDIYLLTREKAGEADINDFELTDDSGLCDYCNFQPLCSFLENNNNEYDEKLYLESIQAQ